MAKHVDHEQRRSDILAATRLLVAERGIRAVSFREIGRRLGGSTTLVTHYYSDVSELFRDLAESSVASWQTELNALERRNQDPVVRLSRIIAWIVPIVGDDVDSERIRINFVAAELEGLGTQYVLDTWERAVRRVLRRTLAELVPPHEVEHYVDIIRVSTNGIVLSTVEHPKFWTVRRQKRTIGALVDSLHLNGSPARIESS